MTYTPEHFPIFAYTRFAAKARLDVKKQLKRSNVNITNEDIDLINKSSLELFTELLEEKESYKDVWFFWNAEKKYLACYDENFGGQS